MARRLIADRQTIKLIVGIILIGIAIFAFGHHDILDAKLYYSGEFAQLFFSLLSGEHRKAYIRTGILDLVFIHFYSSLVWHEFTKLLGKSRSRFAALVPSVFDLIETGTILFILISGIIFENLDWLGLMTAAKWSTGLIVFIWWLLLLCSRRRQAHRSF